MEPTLLVGDRIFVSKYTYGFSKHSFPFSPNIFRERIFYKDPKQGDAVVFKTPEDNRTDFIKRLIGLPGDEIQFIEGDIFINDQKIVRRKIETNDLARCGKVLFEVDTYGDECETCGQPVEFEDACIFVGTPKDLIKKYKTQLKYEL